jgi:hypothetical protein
MTVNSPFAKIQDSLPPLTPPPPPISAADLMGLGGGQSAPNNVFASTPDVTLDQNPAHQVKGAFANGNPSEAISLKEQQKLAKDYDADSQQPTTRLGKAGHVFQEIGNAVLPGLMARIPGTEMHRQGEEMGLQKSLQELLKEQSQEGLENANAGHINAETPEVAPNAESLRKEQGAQTENLESETRDRDLTAAQGPSLASAYAHAVNESIKRGEDPSQNPIVQHLGDAITSLQKQPAEPGGPKTISKEIGGQEHTFAYDPATKDYTKDEGLTGTKPPVVRVETPGEERGAKNDLLKAYQPTLDSAERLNVMTESFEKAVKDHDQQAMLNLLANHLGMTMGLQKGARMTKDIVNEAKNSRPELQGMETKFDKDGYLSGVTLSVPQMRQMVGLGQERYAEDVKKSRATAQYLGAKDDGPERVPGKATINYYLGKAGGDPNKAKQLATEDGWTVK